MKTKSSDCWYTPPQIVDLIQKCLSGITLDPCADDGKHIEACHHFTADDDGLSHQWSGRIFMNPPYSCPGVWIAKLQEEFNCGRVEEAIALVPVATDTKWFHPLIASNLICFWRGRIKFLDVNYQPKMPARQSHALIYWGKNQSRFRQVFSPFGNFNFLEERLFKIGDRFEIIAHKKYSGEKGYLSGYHTNDSPEFWVKLDSYDLQIRVFPDQVKFLKEKGAFAPCQDSHNLTSAQELAQDFPLPPQDLEDLNSLEPQRLTNTVAISCQSDSQKLTTTATCPYSPTLEHLDCNEEQLISSQLRHHVSPSQCRGKDLQQMTKGTVSPQSLELSTPTDPDLQLSKTSQDCSPVPTQEEIEECILTTLEVNSKNQDTLSKGLSFQVVTLQPPLIEEDCYWLPSPTALSTKSSRPPGQTKLENFLKENAIINKGQVINPDFLESTYDLPIGWTDPQDNRSVWEFLEETKQCAIAVPPLETPLTGELPPSDFAASPTSTPCAENQPLQKLKAITLHQPWAYLVAKVSTGENKSGAFRGRYKWFETRSWSTNYRGKIAIHTAKKQHDTEEWCSLLKDLLPPVEELVFGAVVAIAELTDCILMTEEFINQQSETELRCGLWEVGRYAWKLENIQILTEPIPAKGKQGLWNIKLLIPPIKCTQQSGDVACPSCESPLIILNNGCGVCGWTPENSSEESEAQPVAVQKPKGRQRKGCLYKYIENKKLKNGSIASYPRVIGHRKPDNPTHWRWGFNWEEKIDGEWKGRSIGSVPLGAIALIQSMQNEGVSLEEIIGFIRRAKSKKS